MPRTCGVGSALCVESLRVGPVPSIEIHHGPGAAGVELAEAAAECAERLGLRWGLLAPPPAAHADSVGERVRAVAGPGRDDVDGDSAGAVEVRLGKAKLERAQRRGCCFPLHRRSDRDRDHRRRRRPGDGGDAFERHRLVFPCCAAERVSQLRDERRRRPRGQRNVLLVTAGQAHRHVVRNASEPTRRTW